MGVLKRNLWLAHLGVVLVVIVLWGARAGAVTGAIRGTATDRAGTLVLYPKVIADGTRDTVIMLTNTNPTERSAHCVYVNGAGFCSVSQDLCSPPPAASSGCPFGESCVPAWIETNFDITLTRQQPTMWRVSTGRRVDPTDDPNGSCINLGTCQGGPTPGDECELPDNGMDCGGGTCVGICVGGSNAGDACTFPSGAECLGGGFCQPSGQSCPGFDPGLPFAEGDPFGGVIPPNQPFQGELKCYETEDAGGAPMGGDSFKGEAIIETLGSGQISVYNSINIQAGQLDADLVLELNNSELNVCPDTIEFSNYAHLASDPIAESLDDEACDDFGLCRGGSTPGAACDIGGAPCPGGGVCAACPVRTEITMIPCTQNFEAQVPIPTTVQIRSIDQLEFSQSASFNLVCWANLQLDELSPSIFDATTRGEFLKTRLFTSSTGLRCLDGELGLIGEDCDVDADCGAGGVCGPQPGVLAIMEEFHDNDDSLDPGDDDSPGTAAANGHMVGQRTGLCRNTIGLAVPTECADDGDCTGGLCHVSGAACAGDGTCTLSPLDRCDICLIDEVIIPEVNP